MIYCNSIAKFVDELSTWYVRRSRDRFKSENNKGAVDTLQLVLSNLAKVMAPVMPFISEEIQQDLKLKGSVHLEDWPKHDNKLISEKLHENMDLTRELVSMSLEKRESAKVPIRQPLKTLTIKGVELNEEFLDLIKEELNVKEVKVKKSKEVSVELDTKLTQDLIEEGLSREFIRKINNQRFNVRSHSKKL
jgi:isoleucyl-tRNA synthetase